MQIIHRLVGARQAKGFVRRLIGASEVAKAISTHPDMVVLSLAESTVPSHWLRDFLINLFQHSPTLTPSPLRLIGEVVPNVWLPGYSPAVPSFNRVEPIQSQSLCNVHNHSSSSS